jgi:hypothetical protein
MKLKPFLNSVEAVVSINVEAAFNVLASFKDGWAEVLIGGCDNKLFGFTKGR